MDSRTCIVIRKELDIVGARQLGRDITKSVGFSIVDQARIITAISELARNIYLYSNHGEICCEKVSTLDKRGIKITARDTGPGIQDVGKVMQDGFSTSGGLGAGLPGVKRLMDQFDIVSEEGRGTEITTVKWLR